MVVPSRPSLTEEKEFVTAFGHLINHAVASVAAHPREVVSPGSIADRVAQEYSRFEPQRHMQAQARAAGLLSAAREVRQSSFGRFFDREAAYWKDAPQGLDAEMKQLLKKAVYGRLHSLHDELKSSLDVFVATHVAGNSDVPAKTWVQVGFFSGDVQAGFASQKISSPVTLQFRWWTHEDRAERGVWELVRVTKSGGGVLVAAGHAGDAPGSVFEIDFSKYLPAQPSSVPAKYLVRVTAGTKPTVIPTGVPGTLKKIPGKAVGPTSEPVVIVYSAVETSPVQFDFVEVYQTLRFGLESIYLKQDQTGPGAEEFHVTGFVQETFRTESDVLGEQSFTLGGYAVLAFDEDDTPDHAYLGGGHSFYLSKPSTEEWPRAYTVIVSVLEEDGGESLGEWQKGMTNVAKSVISDDFDQIVGDYLQEFFEDHVQGTAETIANYGSQLANLVGSIFGFVGAWVGAVIGLVASAILYGASDDYYGTEVFVLILDSNDVDAIHAMTGVQTNNGYVIGGSLMFQGHATYPEAVTFDGEVEVTFSFTFSNKFTTSI